MPLDTRMVGQSTEPFTHDVDERWIMAYAAGLQDRNPAYLDTHAHTVSAHPLFPVCLEWPVILSSRMLPGYENTSTDEARRGVHAAHDLHIYRPIRAGDQLTTQATVIALEGIRPGAAQTSRLDTTDARTGELVSRTYQLGISRGVAVTGEPRMAEAPPAPPSRPDTLAWQHHKVAIDAGAAHVYTECARIWNPIHTDRAVALNAGLPDIILHGTATLAHGISIIVNNYLNGANERVYRVGGQFRGMVLMPSELTVRVAQNDDTIHFDVLTDSGDAAVANGYLCVRAEDS